MAKKKGRRRKQGLFSKVINMALIALAFARPLQLFFFNLGGDLAGAAKVIVQEATFGLSEGTFDLNAGLRMYTPAVGAFALGKMKSFAMRHFPVR